MNRSKISLTRTSLKMKMFLIRTHRAVHFLVVIKLARTAGSTNSGFKTSLGWCPSPKPHRQALRRRRKQHLKKRGFIWI